MSSSEFDAVQAEKSDAMRRYRSCRIFRFCLLLSGAFTLFFCLFTWFPYVQKIASAYLSDFNSQLFVFLLINALVFFIYHLSNASAAGKNDSVSHRPDIYDQYVSSSSSRRKKIDDEEKRLVIVPPETVETVQRNENIFHKTQIVIRCENADCALVEENPVGDLAVSIETYKIDREKKNFRRMRSEKYSEEKIKRSDRPRELRRSETENGREMVVGGGHTPTRKSMQEMNNEEFRLTIESFIASKRKNLRDHNLAVLMEERKESFTEVTSIQNRRN